MGRMRTAPALGLLTFIVCCGVIAGASTQEDTLKVSVDLVNVPFSVTDRQGRFVSSLTAKDFLVQEDGRRQEIRNFARENELPVTLAMLIDTSPSVRPVFDEEQETAKAFLESIIRTEDLALIIAFDRSVTLIQDYTDNIKLLHRAIDELEIGGGTSLYDAVYLAAKEKLESEAERKAIIVISDGEDTTSKLKFNDALRAAHNSDTIVYAIFNSARNSFPYFRRGRPGSGGGDIGALRKLSAETGGATFALNNDNTFGRIFDQIAQELRSQYSLGYFSTNTARDGKFREIKIVPRNSGYTVRARKGYYAAKGTDTR
jgi:VWFA-related protein